MQYDILGYVVAAVIAAGGIYGYFKAGEWNKYLFTEFVIQPLVALIWFRETHSFIKGSIPSLIAGLAFGALLGE